MSHPRLRHTIISVFVIIWMIIFHYESTRHFYLEPLLNRPLPKVKFLFPPAGWIMFFNVDDQFGHAEVYGVTDGDALRVVPIDPHEILPTRFIGFDNVKRNVLSSVLHRHMKEPFCRYLNRKFPDFDRFLVTAVHYPSVTKTPHERYQSVVYQCY